MTTVMIGIGCPGGNGMKIPRLAFVMVALAVLAGCAAPAATPAYQAQPPAGGEVFRLDVAEVLVTRATVADRTAAIDMTDAVDAWLRRHLVPVGASGRVEAVINNAAVREAILRRTAPGGTSFERIRQFDGLVDVRLDAIDRTTQRVGFAAGSGSRGQAVPFDTPQRDLEVLANGMADALMIDLQQSLGADIRRRMGRFVR